VPVESPCSIRASATALLLATAALTSKAERIETIAELRDLAWLR
jgi:hypothetical protein